MTEFRPEFFNRIDAVISFQPLAPETIAALASRELEALARREGLTKARLRLTWTDAVIERLVAVGYDPRYGARPLLRAVEHLVVTPLSRWLLANPAAGDSALRLELNGNLEVIVRNS